MLRTLLHQATWNECGIVNPAERQAPDEKQNNWTMVAYQQAVLHSTITAVGGRDSVSVHFLRSCIPGLQVGAGVSSLHMYWRPLLLSSSLSNSLLCWRHLNTVSCKASCVQQHYDTVPASGTVLTFVPKRWHDGRRAQRRQAPKD